jgi:Zn-dependent membrane protease YugP
LLGILVTWWPVFALLYVPRLAQVLATAIWKRTKSKLDHQIPDELPMTAGEWLAVRLAQLGHPIGAIVTDQQRNLYRPDDRLIQLSDETHFKADPVFWATAAHELGHARLRAELPIIGYLRTSAGWAGFVLAAAGVGLAFGRVLYALPRSGELAFGCFAIAAGLRIFVLLDEALASVLAYRELRANDAIDFVHLRAVRRALVAAFATYFVTFAAYALLLRSWPLVEALAGDHGARASELTRLGWTVAAVVSIGCVLAIVTQLTRMFAPREVAETLDRRGWWLLLVAIVRTSPILVLLWLAWDHRADATYAWCATLAFAASGRAWLMIVHLPFVIPHSLLAVFVQKLEGPGLHRTSRYMRARQQGAHLVRAGNQRLERITEAQTEHPSWPARLTALGKLGYVPLLVAFWLAR